MGVCIRILLLSDRLVTLVLGILPYAVIYLLCVPLAGIATAVVRDYSTVKSQTMTFALRFPAKYRKLVLNLVFWFWPLRLLVAIIRGLVIHLPKGVSSMRDDIRLWRMERDGGPDDWY